MEHGMFERTRIVARGTPLSPGERALVARDIDDTLALVARHADAPSAVAELRALLGHELCVPVHQLSDPSLLREISARVQRGELEVRATPIRIPTSFPRWE